MWHARCSLEGYSFIRQRDRERALKKTSWFSVEGHVFQGRKRGPWYYYHFHFQTHKILIGCHTSGKSRINNLINPSSQRLLVDRCAIAHARRTLGIHATLGQRHVATRKRRQGRASGGGGLRRREANASNELRFFKGGLADFYFFFGSWLSELQSLIGLVVFPRQ